MPTFERLARFDREFRRLPRELQRAFLATLPMFIAALRSSPPAFPPSLRVKRVQGASGVWEMTYAPDVAYSETEMRRPSTAARRPSRGSRAGGPAPVERGAAGGRVDQPARDTS